MAVRRSLRVDGVPQLQVMDDRARAKVEVLLKYSDRGILEVPDPYYGDVEEFQATLDLVGSGAGGLLKAIERDHFS